MGIVPTLWVAPDCPQVDVGGGVFGDAVSTQSAFLHTGMWHGQWGGRVQP